MSENFLGEFEELILLAVRKLGPHEAYGLAIAETIEEATGRRVAIGVLYNALGPLEEKGFLQSRTTEPIEELNGRRRKYYTATSGGLEMLKKSAQRHTNLLDNRNFSPALYS